MLQSGQKSIRASNCIVRPPPCPSTWPKAESPTPLSTRYVDWRLNGLERVIPTLNLALSWKNGKALDIRNVSLRVGNPEMPKFLGAVPTLNGTPFPVVGTLAKAAAFRYCLGSLRS